MIDNRIFPPLADKIMSAEQAAELIKPGMVIGCSGFTLVGDPKAVPMALAKQGKAKNLTMFTGASVGDQMDGELARAGLLARRYPYQSNKDIRMNANNGNLQYVDMHLSQMPHFLKENHVKIDYAVIECAAITEDGAILGAAVGAANTFLQLADHVIFEVNESLPLALYGMHDIYQPCGEPIKICGPKDRIGTYAAPFDLHKVMAIVKTSDEGHHPTFKDPDEVSRRIAQNIVMFLKSEISAGRQPKNLSPLQSGVGSVANAVLAGLAEGCFSGLTMYTEVVQDSAIHLIRSGVIENISTTAVSLSDDCWSDFVNNIDFFNKHIIVRPQEISNNAEVIRRLGVIAMNTPLECDIYGNVNSTHVMGTKIMNGIGGSGDFARNAGLSIFATESVAKGGAISCIVPMCSHIDHTEHDVQVIVTEQGIADLRWKSPRERAELIIENCAHPDYRPMLREYYRNACELSGHIPHDLSQALSWHQRYLQTGTMQK